MTVIASTTAFHVKTTSTPDAAEHAADRPERRKQAEEHETGRDRRHHQRQRHQCLEQHAAAEPSPREHPREQQARAAASGSSPVPRWRR